MQTTNESTDTPEQGNGNHELSQVQEDLPLDLYDSPEVVRGEVNLKRFGNVIFPHYRTKDLDKARSFSFPHVLADGKVSTQKITIQPAVGEKAYTTYTQRVYYALVLLWYERGRPDGSLIFSLRDLARKMHLSWSGTVAHRLLRELVCLKKTNISWVLAFEITDGTRETFRYFNILSDLVYETIDERQAGQQFETTCRLVFQERILSNILSNKVAPVNFTALLSMHSSIAEMFYIRIDSILAARDFCHWTSLKLLEELNLADVAEYLRNPSKRKGLLQKIAREVNLKPLSSGELILVSVEQTADGKDWKILCTKTRPSETDIPDRPNLAIVNRDPELIEYLAGEITAAVGYSNENELFYQKLARHYPREIVFRVLAEFRTERPSTLKNPGGFFADKFHRVAHNAGFEWIKECGLDCPRRPGNSLL
jgi:hypothetical protein